MTNFIRMTSLAATVAALAVTTPALAAPGNTATPTQQATATARVGKPLTIAWKQDLDLGTIVLGSGVWAGADVGISSAKAFSCTSTNVPCSGTPKTAENTGTVNLGNSGAAGLVLDLGGKVTVASTTVDGTYSGTFAVTVNY